MFPATRRESVAFRLRKLLRCGIKPRTQSTGPRYLAFTLYLKDERELQRVG